MHVICPLVIAAFLASVGAAGGDHREGGATVNDTTAAESGESGPIVLENDALRVDVSGEDFGITVTAKGTGKRWTAPNPFYAQYGPYGYNIPDHTRATVKREGNRVTFSFDAFVFWARFKGHGYVKPEPGPPLAFTFTVTLEGDHVAFGIEPLSGMDDEEVRIRYPHGLMTFDSQETAQLVFPFGFGVLFEFPRKDMLSFSESYGRPHYTMPVYGLFQENGGLGVYLKTPFDSRTTVEANTSSLGNAAVWNEFVFEKENANYTRELRIYPLGADETYVDLAKRYRAILREEGRFVTLREKISESPEVEKLVGAVIWKHNVYSGEVPEGVEKSHSLYMLHPEQNEYEGLPNNWSAREVFDTAKSRGFDRVTVYNTGWNYGGFDSHYPTRLPPNPERGTEEQFREAAEYARSLSPGFIYSVHDNYYDVYRNSEEFDLAEINHTKDGAPVKGGVWRGGRAYLMCTANGMKYAERDIPRMAALLGKGSIYVDVLGSVGLQSCHHPAHPQGEREDAESRRRMLRFIKSQMGSLATEGNPADYLCDIVDLGAYCYYHYARASYATRPVPVPVPFWQLVYHDSVLNYTSESTFKAYGSEYILYVALYGMLPTALDDVSKRLSFGLREAYTAEMINHEFLEKPAVSRGSNGCYWTSGVARTSFADGTIVIANFGKEPYAVDGKEVPGREFVILNGGNEG